MIIYIYTKFNENGTGVQAILRLSLRNLKGCNVGITGLGIYDIRR
jgi:hypothetical protein